MQKLSIIIPCFNDAVHIEEAINSALTQTWEDKEIIVVDDGSNAKTKALLKQLQPKIDLLITQENLGPSGARNRGIEAAKGEYILALDSDDYFEREFCEKAVKCFKRDSEMKMVTSFARWFTSEEEFQIFKPRGGGLNNFLLNNSSLGTMFKKTDWEKAGGYDENMRFGFEDWEFYIRVHKNGGYTHVIPEVLFHYRKRPASRNVTANEQKYELLEYIYLKHQDLYKENFEAFIAHLISLLKHEKREISNIKRRKEFRLGKALLQPLRFFKSFR